MLGKNILSQNCVPALYATQSTSWGFSLPPFRLVKHADGTLDTVLINDVNSRTTSTLIAMAAVHQTETTETCCPQMDFSYAKKKKRVSLYGARARCRSQRFAERNRETRQSHRFKARAYLQLINSCTKFTVYPVAHLGWTHSHDRTLVKKSDKYISCMPQITRCSCQNLEARRASR